MTTKAGAVFHFVYDPTASIPAVVYEEGGNRRFVNIREPDGSLVGQKGTHELVPSVVGS